MTIKLFNYAITIFEPLEFGEGTSTQYLWDDEYGVCFKRMLGIPFLLWSKLKKL